MLSRRLLPLLVVWCLLVVLPGVVITAVFDIDIDSDIGGWVLGSWIIGYLAQLGVFLAVSRVAQRNNILGWFIASLAPFVSDWGSPASIWGPLIAAVISGGFACWLYWSCTRQADLRAHGIPATDQLERLAQLHRNGQLTDAEFGAAKARLLGG